MKDDVLLSGHSCKCFKCSARPPVERMQHTFMTHLVGTIRKASISFKSRKLSRAIRALLTHHLTLTLPQSKLKAC